MVLFALCVHRSKIVKHTILDAGEAHVIPELLAMSVREVVHRFALDEDRRVPVHDAEVSEITVLNRVALVVGREQVLLVEGNATERQFDSQCVLVHVLVEEGSEVFVHLLARSQGRVDELFVCGFICVCHSIWVENYNNYNFFEIQPPLFVL